MRQAHFLRSSSVTLHEKLVNRLTYAFRPAVVLVRLSYDRSRIRYSTRDKELILEPIEFLARLTLHTTRAPPRKLFERYSEDADISYDLIDENLDASLDLPQISSIDEQVLNQLVPKKEEFINQKLSW